MKSYTVYRGLHNVPKNIIDEIKEKGVRPKNPIEKEITCWVKRKRIAYQRMLGSIFGGKSDTSVGFSNRFSVARGYATIPPEKEKRSFWIMIQRMRNAINYNPNFLITPPIKDRIHIILEAILHENQIDGSTPPFPETPAHGREFVSINGISDQQVLRIWIINNLGEKLVYQKEEG